MRARSWVLACVLGWAGTAAADPKPTPVDLKEFKARLIILQDAHGGTYAVTPVAAGQNYVFYGTGKTLYSQYVTFTSTNGPAWSLSTWAPRLADLQMGTVELREDGTYQKACAGKDDEALTLLTGDKAKAVLDKYAFLTTPIIHVPHLLARDDAGIYYYVDKLAKAYGGKGFRVFVGRKGAMRQVSLVDIASDTMGEVFSTKTGDLRLVRTSEPASKESTTWIKGEKRTELLKLDLDVNSPIIFRELGIYKSLGTLCDNV